MKVWIFMKMPLVYRYLLKFYFAIEDFVSRRFLYYVPKWFDQVHPKNLFDFRARHFLERLGPTDRVADLGAGTGRLAEKMVSKTAKVIAVDRSVPNAQRASSDCLSWMELDVTDPSLPKELQAQKVNVIVLSHILEHIEETKRFLSGLSFAEKLLICVPSSENWRFQLKAVLGLDPMTDQTHFREYSMATLEAELLEAGFKKLEIFYNSEGEIFGVFEPLRA